MSEPSFHFDLDTAVVPAATGTWNANVADDYNIGENPNGGYLMAIVLQALRAEIRVADPTLDQPDPLTLTAHFLRPGVPNASAEITTEVLKLGRAITTVRATMRQEGKARVEMVAGFGDLASGPSGFDMTVDAPELPAPDECVDRSVLAQGVVLPLLSRVEVRVPPDQVELGDGGPAFTSGWIRFVDGRPVDSLALALFADAFPPSLFASFGSVGWVPTLEMTVHVRRRPANGWVMATFDTDDLDGGRFVETGALWDVDGNLVARSRQLGMMLT